jgi:hydroxyacylglutathione hydrolase
MLEILPIPAFRDNYIWLLHNGRQAAVVDPGDATPVIEKLKHLGLQLDTILVTHHHDDHIGGISTLLQNWPAIVYAPRHASHSFPHVAVTEGSQVTLAALDTTFTVLAVPGHTLEHVAYYGANWLFCGDTLFGAGCGRLFEGTPAQMFESLQRLAAFPAETMVYCTHEYTEHNLRFAHDLEPHNEAVTKRLRDTIKTRAEGRSTLPSTIQQELATNPFLRCHSESLQMASGFHKGTPLQVFTAIREMRNNY